MVLGGEYLPQRILLLRVRKSGGTFIVENKYGGGLFDLVCDVGDLVRMDSGDFHDKRKGFCDWDGFCVIESVGFPLVTSLTGLTGLGNPVFRF